MPRLTIVILLLLTFMRSAAQLSPKITEVDSLLTSIYKNDAPGISISIIENGKSIFAKSYGVADVITGAKIGPATSFNIGSVTKQFTAFATLQLAEKGKLSLDDHLSKFFPGLNKNLANAITVKQLLTHSSGIVDHYDLVDTKNLKHAHINDVFNAIKNADSTYFHPGSQFRYSNTAYCLLSLIIEKVSGMRYAQYLGENIFRPLGMNQTVVWNEKQTIRNEASGYEWDTTSRSFKKSGADENIFFSTEGDGGIYTCIDDYLKWFTALQSGNLFSRKLIREARAPQFVIDKQNHLSYGYGWFIDDASAFRKVYHSGSNGGFRAYVFSIPEKNFLILIFSNRDDVDLEKLVKEIHTLISPW